MTVPYIFQVDWNNDNDFGDTGEDVSERVDGDIGVVWSRGKDQLRQFAPAAAGQSAFVLNNLSRDYSPGNMSSPLYSLVVPGRKIQISSSGSAGEAFSFVDDTSFQFVDGSTFESMGSLPGRVIWTGILDDISQHPEPVAREVGLSCLGALSRLRGKTISTALYQDILTSTFLGHVLDAAGWPAGERTIQTGLTTLAWAWVDNEDAFDVVERIRATEGPGASLYENPSGYLIFENRDARTTQTRSTVSQATFTDTANITALDYNPNYKDTIEAALITVDERQAQGQSVIWEYGSDLTLGVNEVKRLQVRSSSDPFTNAIIPSPVPNDTVQTMTADEPLTTGTFKVRFREVTSAGTLDWDATAAEIQTALEGLSSIGSGNVECLGGPISTSPVSVSFIGVFAGQAITDLIEVVSSTLNPMSVPATVTVTEDFAGTALLAERQSLRPSTTLTGGGPFTISVTTNLGGGTTGNIAYNASAATVQTALRLLSDCGSFNVSGGPMSSGSPLTVAMVTAPTDDFPLMTIGGTALTGSVPGTSISVAITTQGGVADYVITAGAATFTLNRTSGASAQLTITAGAAGVTITGLRLRGQLVSVVRSHQVSFPEDVTSIPEGKIMRPNVKPEISLANAREFVETFVYYYASNRPTVTFQVLTSIYASANDLLYQREISDRITIVEGQTGINEDYHIEQIRQSVSGIVLITEFGCEQAPPA